MGNKKVPKRIRIKLPNIAIEILRKCGGAHSSPKGKKGYNRKSDKQNFDKTKNEDSGLFYLVYFWARLGIAKFDNLC